MGPLPDCLFNLYLGVFAQDLVRYALAAGGVHLAVNLAFGAALAHRLVRPEPRPGWMQIRREIAASLRTTAIFAAFGTLIAVGAQRGLLPVYTDIGAYGLVWLPLSLVLLVVGHDAFFYWAHRLLHRPRLFRPLHRVHHLSRNPTAFAAYSFNAGEAATHAAYLPLALAAVPAHPVVIFLFTAHMIVRNAVGHCGTELFPADRNGQPLWGWLTTVTHHDLHHENGRWNLGLYFTWWDRLCGTEHPDYATRFRKAVGRVAAVVLAVALVWPGGASAFVAGLEGGWLSSDLSRVIRLGSCAGDPTSICVRHAYVSGAARARWVLSDGLVFQGPTADGGSWSGRMTNPETGRPVTVRLRFLGSDRLEVRSCDGRTCRCETWHSTRWLETMIRPPIPFP